jgi:hypothetical protein
MNPRCDNPIQADGGKRGWSRPLYLLRRGVEAVCGYLERDDTRYVLLSGAKGQPAMAKFTSDELPFLSRVAGIAVPI